jgi:hypothetical protein
MGAPDAAEVEVPTGGAPAVNEEELLCVARGGVETSTDCAMPWAGRVWAEKAPKRHVRARNNEEDQRTSSRQRVQIEGRGTFMRFESDSKSLPEVGMVHDVVNRKLTA